MCLINKPSSTKKKELSHETYRFDPFAFFSLSLSIFSPFLHSFSISSSSHSHPLLAQPPFFLSSFSLSLSFPLSLTPSFSLSLFLSSFLSFSLSFFPGLSPHFTILQGDWWWIAGTFDSGSLQQEYHRPSCKRRYTFPFVFTRLYLRLVTPIRY